MTSIKTVTLAAFAFALTSPLLPKAVLAKAPPIYTVSKVDVTSDAEDAVAAKEKALALAQRKALRRLFKRMTAHATHAKLPVLDDTMIERMVEGFAVRRESNSTTRYMATLDFSFEPNAVRDILNRFGFPYTDQQAPETLLIPLMIEGGAVKQGSENAWHEAFEEIDVAHALAPLKIGVPRANLSAAMVGDLSGSSRSIFETLAYQYRSQNLVLAIADVDAQATRLHFRLIGRDAVGGFSLDRKFKIFDRDIDYTAEMAADVAVKVIEGRWKMTRLASQGALEGPADLETVSLTAQFAGLKAWRAMRSRLQQVPGLQALDVKGLNARGANLTVDFPGGAERLAQAAQTQGLALERRGDRWVLIAR